MSQDPRVGNGQYNATFWDRITTHFNNVAPSSKRPQRSLESKRSAINQDASKFVGVHSRVEILRRSGTHEADILVEALDLYKIKHPKGASFTYLQCWYCCGMCFARQREALARVGDTHLHSYIPKNHKFTNKKYSKTCPQSCKMLQSQSPRPM